MTSVSDNRVSYGGTKNQNYPSSLLSNQQNNQLFELMGSNKFTLSTGVAQVFSTEPPAHSVWVKRHTGVLCFVKDYTRKSYYMQMYCLNREEVIWEHEVYEPFIMNTPRPYMLTFEGSDRIVALNFVSDEEASGFIKTVRNVVSNRMRRHEERSRRTAKAVNIALVDNTDGGEAVTLRKPKHSISTKTVHEISTKKPIHEISTLTPISTQMKGKKDKKFVKKVNKADIGAPSGFQHITHVGWDSYKGFNFKGDDEEVLKPFLEKAGVSEKLLKNRETKAFILDFIQENKVLESIYSEQTLPPVPPRQSQKIQEPNQNKPYRVAPPPPPLNRPSPNTANQVPKPPRVNISDPPKRSPQNSIKKESGPPTGAPPPPPPPPPPMDIMAPPKPPPILESNHDKPSITSQGNSDPHSALLDSIRQGTKLKKVEEKSTISGGSGSRNDFLEEIRQGTKLRPAEDRVVSDQLPIDDETKASDALALALKRALEQRKGAIHSDSDDDTDESFDNDNEWED